MKPNSLPKSMMVSGRLAVSALLEKGKGGVSGCLRYKWVERGSAQVGGACHTEAPSGLSCHTEAPSGLSCHTEAPSGAERISSSRILVSVPKKLFHRAVKRNLLKRRMREAFRVQQGLIGPGLDILFVYISKAVLPFETIYADMTAALTSIASCHFDQTQCAEKSHE